MNAVLIWVLGRITVDSSLESPELALGKLLGNMFILTERRRLVVTD